MSVMEPRGSFAASPPAPAEATADAAAAARDLARAVALAGNPAHAGTDALAAHNALADRERRNFSEQEVTAVWSRAQMIPGLTPRMFRLCSAGRIIARADYNNRSSSFGWRIDHIVRLADGGTNSVTNLQPLNWQASSKSV